MEKGVFTISIDYEFAWGYADHRLSDEHKAHIKNETAITRRLLALFDKYNIPATWAVVSELLEEGSDVIWHDIEKLIPEIKNARAQHEIGSHSYAHILYNSPRDHVVADVMQAQTLHKKNNLDFTSFIFPRNVEGHHDELVRAGITSFRHHHAPRYSFLPRRLYRACNLLSYFFPTRIVEAASIHPSGLVSIPGGMLLLGRNGFRSLVPPRCMIGKATRSLHAAAQRRGIFHLWFHPSNFSYDTEKQFSILEEILQEANILRTRGLLQIMTMCEITETIQAALPVDKAVASHHQNAQIFANRYKAYDVNPYSSAFTYDRKRLFDFLISFLKRNIPEKANILDVGAGTGYFLHTLHKQGYAVVGVEPAPAMYEQATKQYPELALRRGAVNELPFADNSFDAVTAIEVFRYLNTDDQEKGYQECLRVLKPGGMLVVSLVNRYALDGFIIKYYFFMLLEMLHIKELPNYCDFKTPRAIQHFFNRRIGIAHENIQTTGVMFAPVRLAYKISRSFGEWFARRVEKFDTSLTDSAWHRKFAGYLVLMVKK